MSLFKYTTGPGYVDTCAGAAGCTNENSVSFARRMDTQRSALIAQITGHVSVGAMQPLEVPAEVKQNASQKVLDRTTTLSRRRWPRRERPLLGIAQRASHRRVGAAR